MSSPPWYKKHGLWEKMGLCCMNECQCSPSYATLPIMTLFPPIGASGPRHEWERRCTVNQKNRGLGTQVCRSAVQQETIIGSSLLLLLDLLWLWPQGQTDTTHLYQATRAGGETEDCIMYLMLVVLSKMENKQSKAPGDN